MSFSAPEMIDLAGGCNLRDLGGHGTADGRKVARGLLYRSGVLSYLTPADHQLLLRLELRTVVDLRRPDEIAAEPIEWPVPVRTLSFLEDPHHGPGQRGAPWEQSASEAEACEWMMRSYATMHVWLAPHLRAIFRSILQRELPLLFHCAAGKDRTGFCAGVTLSLLGVPEETVLDEFAFTDQAVDLYEFTQRFRVAGLGVTDAGHPFDLMEAGVRRALLAADRRYLKAALDSVVEAHGGIVDYVIGTIGLTPTDISDLRALLVVD